MTAAAIDGGVSRRGGWLASLRLFLVPRADRCDLCGAAIGADHGHLLERNTRRLLCACAPCGTAVHQRYRRVPRQVRRLDDFCISDSQWDALQIPIGMAFFYRTDEGRVVARYPGAAGAVESLLDLEAWSMLAAANPVLDEMECEVEALLVNRTEHARDYYRVPIDRCYLLVALVRRHWRGLPGGEEARAAIAAFFGGLRDGPANPGRWHHA